jgi:hypothetical protein
MSKIFPFLAVILLLGTVALTGCAKKTSGDFGIYLVDSGELVLSDQYIKAYYQRDHTIQLNEKGIERWNSFQTYTGIPKLDNTLYGRDFMVRLKGEEIYTGKFYSRVSSASYDGVIIMDSLFRLDNIHNTINIQFGYPGTFDAAGQDPRDNPAIISYFKKCGLLK